MPGPTEQIKRLHKRVKKMAAPAPPPKKLHVISMMRWIETYLWIRPIGGGVERLRLNKFQKILIALIVKLLKLGKPVRLVVLKSRQLGISTVVQAVLFYMVMHYPEWRAMVIAHQKGPARNLYRMTRRYYQHLPVGEKKPLRSGRLVPSKEGLDLDHPHSSEMVVVTAESEEVARSETLQGVHCSEEAFFRDPDTTMTALEQAVHEVANTIFIIESTANGLNSFKQYWDRAHQKDSIWIPLFFSWKDDPKSRIEILPGEIFELDDQEIEFKEKYGLTLEQIKWARYKRDDKCHGSWEKFHQEYPVAPEVAFLYTGYPIFNQKLLREQLELAQQSFSPLFMGDIEFKSATEPVAQLVKLATGRGPLIVYKEPEPRRSYVSGHDPSEGGGTKADYNTSVVLDDETGELAAEYASNLDRPTKYAIKTYQIGIFYNSGLMGIERNAVGQAVLGALEHGIDERRQDDPTKLKYPQLRRYPDLYFEMKYDEKIQKESKRLGFSTSKNSKRRIISQLAEAHSEGSFVPRSPAMILQMQGLVWEESSKKKGYKQNYKDPLTKNPNDDLIMAAAIAYDMRLHRFGSRFCPKPEQDEWEGIAA
jgi:hypothetical protein